ncbi:MAG: T9SS type A sorting domain-containing protein, partial [Flavobacteriales bacterium]|nr:T9SS type A sorting domain-containing protein [Flavobacteriales bacterium]
NSTTFTLSGHTGNVVRWESSTSSTFASGVTNIANTTTTLTATNLTTTTTYYRAVVQSGTCATANSATGTVTVSPASVGGTIAGSASVCTGTNSTTFTLSGHTGNVVRWESSTSSTFASGVTNIANTTTTLTATNLSATTYYRAVVQSGTCATANSATGTVTVSPASVGGTIAGSASVCTGTNSTTLTLSGHTGNVVRWESSLDNFATAGTTIANTTTTLTATNLTATTYYRAVVQSGSCATANSATGTVTVSPASVGGTIAGSASVCTGTNSTTLTLSGHIGNVVRWESSTSSTFASGVTNITNTTTTLTATNLTATTYYRAVVQSGTCTTANSATGTVTVSPASVGGTIAGSASVCTGTNSTTLTLSGHTGNVVRWESSLDNFATAGTTIANTTTTLTATNLTATTYYRAVVQSGTCATANSATGTVTVSPASVGGTIVGSASVCTGTNSTTFTLSGHTGNVVRWESSLDNFATAGTTIANTTTTLTATNLTTTTYYRAVVNSGACAAENSTISSVIVNQPIIEISVNNIDVANGDYLWNGNVSGDCAVLANWYQLNNGVWSIPTSPSTQNDKVYIVNYNIAGSCVSATNSAQIPSEGSFNSKDVYVGEDASLTIGLNSKLNVFGDFINMGTFTPGVNSTVELSGPTNSVVVMSSNSKTFYNLKLNKTGNVEVQLGSNIAITNELIFSNGNLKIMQNEVDLGTTGNLIGESASSYAYCDCPTSLIKAIRNISANSTVDPGSLGLSINPSVDMGTVVVERRHERLPLPVYNGQSNSTNSENSIERSYVVKDPMGNTVLNNGSLNATITFKYLNDAGIGALSIYRRANPSEEWTEYGGTHNPDNNTVSFSGWNSFSEVTLGGLGSPLPVELLFLNGSCENETKQIQWATASEKDSWYFQPEYSNDGESWISGDIIEAAGNSNSLLNYEWILDNRAELVYVRLQQYDIDGKIKTYDPILITCDEIQVFELFPNPTSEDVNVIFSLKNASSPIKLSVQDMTGKKVLEQEFVGEEGVNLYRINPNYLPGIYIVQLWGNGKLIGRKQLVIK